MQIIKIKCKGTEKCCKTCINNTKGCEKFVIEVDITKEMRERAQDNATRLGSLRNSILKGEGNFAGFLGEEMVLKVLDTFKSNNDYNWDIRFHKWKFEVKTKQTSFYPIPAYDCSVSKFNPDQKTDYYIFCRVLKPSFEKGWILGHLTKKQYFEETVLIEKGQVDESNDFKAHVSCYNLLIKKLIDPEFLIKSNAAYKKWKCIDI